MKKIIIILILLTGCSSKKIVCTKSIINNNQNYTEKSRYTVYYHNGYVDKIDEYIIYTSNDINMIDYFEKYNLKKYLDFKTKYLYLDYSNERRKNQIIFRTQYDYKKIDADKLSKNNYIDKIYVHNHRISVSGIKSMYEDVGAQCRE